MFRLTYESITAESFDYSGYYTIVVTEFTETNSSIIQNILEDCWERHIINVNILVPQKDTRSQVRLYTYFPFTPFNCEKVRPVIWNYFDEGRLVYLNKQLFPHKIKNLYQCPLTVVTVEIPPYIFIGGVHTNNTLTVQGIDANLINLLAEEMNFKLIVLLPDDMPTRGIIHKNGTVTGAFGMVTFSTK